MKNKLFIVAALSAIAFSTQSCNNKTLETPDTIRSVKLETVENSISLTKKEFSGRISEQDEVKLSFRIAGPVHKLLVSEGQYVKKGDLIAEIDPRDYQLNYNAVKVEYEQVIAETDRVFKLHETKSVSENNYDKAKAGREQISAKFESAKNSLNDTKLIAPFSGYIQEVFISNHETVGAGHNVVSLINVSNMEVEIEIPASVYVLKDKFQSFTCYSEVYPDVAIPLSLLVINRKANLNQLYKMRFLLQPDKKLNVSPGMSAKVEISCSQNDITQLTIPLSAVISENDKKYVWLYNEKDSLVNKKEITVGNLAASGKFNISSGLQAGDKIVVAGVNSISENQKVKPLK